jgi:hypothetical protein
MPISFFPPRATAVLYFPWSLRREAAEMSERNEHEHSIRFITTDYEELFRIPDGGTVLVTFPDRQFAEKCSYIDDYHMKIGSTIYHICQYAEILKQNGGRCEPEPEQIRCHAREWPKYYPGIIQKIHPTMCRLSYESEDRFFAKQEIQYIDMTNAVFIRE